MGKKQDTKEKILDLAEELIQTKGFNAFSYHHIGQGLGIKNAAIHYHYATKPDLGKSVIKRAHQRAITWMQEINSLEDDWEKLEAFIRVAYDANLDRGNRVCLIGSLGTDYFTISKEMKEGLASMSEDIYAWLTSLLEAGRDNGSFHFNGEAADKAILVTACLAGALQIARIVGDQHYRRAVNQLKTDLKNN